jgi:hypothetical protein
MSGRLSVFLAFILSSCAASGAQGLFYLEAQSVAGYSSLENKSIYRSAGAHDAMQKNSVGFDYIQKIAGENKEFGSFALQARLAYDEDESKLQPQVYNAYFKVKSSFADVWAGHNRIAFGLASYWDTHADLLQPLAMYGFGYDRDWGGGVSKVLENGDIVASLTTGAGMPLRTYGNILAAGRVSKGVLNYDNYNLGLSFMGGKMLDTMGYKVLSLKPQNALIGAADGAYNHNNIEHKAEFDFGRRNNETALAAFYRLSFNFTQESRLKIEAQYVYAKRNNMSETNIGGGATCKINADLTSRLMYEYGNNTRDNRIVGQLYWYFRI